MKLKNYTIIMRNFFLTLLLTFFGASLLAADIPVTNTTIVAALGSAADGDVLLLAPGSYGTAFGIQNNKTLTIKSDGTGSVVLTFALASSAGNTGGGLIFDGVIINRNSDYFISAALGKVDILAFRNCIIQNVNRCLVRTTDATALTMTNFELSNNLIKSCGSGGWALTRFNHNLVNVNFKNNTFDSYQGEDIFLGTATAKNTSFNTDFVFENNTVYKSIKAGSYAVCKPADKFSDASSYTFKNNIFNLNYATSSTIHLLSGVTTGGKLVAEKNLIVNFGNTTKSYNYTTIPSVTIADITLTDLELSSIGFADPDNGDFTIVSSSAIATASSTGGVLGDTRWLKTVTAPANLTSSSSPLAGGTVSPASGIYNAGDEVSVTATPNFGYTFKEWQDASTGTVLSTSNPYVFSISADTEVKAVFNTLTTYNFTVNKVGSSWGEVELTPEAVDGKYIAGTEVTMTVIPNRVTSFNYWEDASTLLSRTVTVNSDLNFTATFDEIPFIVGWDFKATTPTSNRQSDYYSQSDKRGTISVYNAGGSIAGWLGNTGISSPSYPNLRLWTSATDFNANNRRYLQASFSTVGYKNIQVASMISGSNQGYAIYKLQYSLDGTTFTDLANTNIKSESYPTPVYKSSWSDLNGTLPADADGKEIVYIRWVADANSEKLDQNINNPGTDVEGTAYTNIFVFADKEIINDNDAPLLVASVPSSNSNTATINGSIVLTFNERIKAGTGNIILDGKVLTGVFGAKTVTFAYEKLSYDTPYTLTVPVGALTDQSGNPFAAYTLTFRTANKLEPIKRAFDAVVAKDGSGDYLSVKDAIAAAPINRTQPWIIYIKNGIYNGHHEIPANKPFIHLIGQSRDGVFVTDNVATDSNPSWEEGSTMYVQGANCYFENITFQNEFGYIGKQGPPALAFYTKGDRFSMKNGYLRSFQDTYFTGNVSTNRHYFLNTRIEGAVDYIYGNGNVFFDKDTLTNVRTGSVIVAPDHSSSTLHGYVFRDCVVNEDASSQGDHRFGRPWKGTPKTVFINTKLLAGINPLGWSDMGVAAEIFADYGTVDKNGNPVDVSQRKSQYYRDGVLLGTAKNFLTDEEAAAYTYENVVLRSGDTWDPRIMAEAPAQPANVKLENSVLTWDATAYTRLYVVLRNNEAIGFPLTNQFTDLTAIGGVNYSYKIQAVGESGALSTTSEVVKTLPVTGLTLKATKANQAVQLNWNTYTEKGTSHFVVERTVDGKSFEQIGFKQAVGNSQNQQQYYFTDKAPLSGTNIYRIKAVDFNGHFEFSDLVAVKFLVEADLAVYPNPSHDYIRIANGPAQFDMNIFDLEGRKLKSLQAMDREHLIDISTLSPGYYILEIIDGPIRKLTRFIKN